MEIHEYQVKKLFQKYAITTLKGFVAYTPDEAVQMAQKIGGTQWAVKAQIHDTNRMHGLFQEKEAGVGSGIRYAYSLEEVRTLTGQMLGKTLWTPSTHAYGQEVKKVYIEELVDIKRAFHISIQVSPDEQKRRLVFMPHGGATKFYDLSANGVSRLILHKLCARTKLSGKAATQLCKIVTQMYKLFVDYKALAVELTPLIITTAGMPVALDGRIVFDSEALFAYPEIAKLKEIETGTEREHNAHSNNFKYTKLGGNIACIANGTGLGLATIDLIESMGGSVSCLLDIGTEPTKEVVAKAFKMVLGEPDIEGVLVNIFGGITRCDTIAQGLIAASHEISVGMPLVVRMDGTNAMVGARLVQESKLPFDTMREMDVAVEQIIKRVQEVA